MEPYGWYREEEEPIEIKEDDVTTQESQVEVVQRLYEAFGRGDVASIAALLAPDVAWEQWEDHHAQRAGVPWLLGRHGRDAALGFFEVLVAELEFNDFQTHAFMAGDDHVAVTVTTDVTVKATRERLRDEEIHLFSFNEAGEVAAMRHYLDTAKHIGAVKR